MQIKQISYTKKICENGTIKDEREKNKVLDGCCCCGTEKNAWKKEVDDTGHNRKEMRKERNIKKRTMKRRGKIRRERGKK